MKGGVRRVDCDVFGGGNVVTACVREQNGWHSWFRQPGMGLGVIIGMSRETVSLGVV